MPDRKPTILVIWSDDIVITDLSCYSDGLMGDRSPTSTTSPARACGSPDSYGEQSCTGMSKVGVTVAERLTSLGYATVQFGKTTQATLYLFYGEEEPESPPTPTRTSSLGQDFAFPRGVLKCRATSVGKQILEDMHTTPSRRASVKRACGSRTWPARSERGGIRKRSNSSHRDANRRASASTKQLQSCTNS